MQLGDKKLIVQRASVGAKNAGAVSIGIQCHVGVVLLFRKRIYMYSKTGLKSGVVFHQELIYIIKYFFGHNQVVFRQRVVSRQEFYCTTNTP